MTKRRFSAASYEKWFLVGWRNEAREVHQWESNRFGKTSSRDRRYSCAENTTTSRLTLKRRDRQ